ncbi:leucine-rich repeat-containing protein 15 [Anabrus simplex]|uniref:leucine-rich repeat-containing protein 15 n=1 Tax=Anabrus simplex TaxID=316456 RepID=UPI0035A2C399
MTSMATNFTLILVLFVIKWSASDSTCPSYCECYSLRTQIVADCTSKMLAAVPNGLPLNITTLRLGYNNLTQIHNSTFAGKSLSLLERLEINDNLLCYIEPGAFHELTRLTRLDLENNRIRLLHPDIFLSLSRLWKLILNGNPLALQEDGPFLVAPQLKVLELERCEIGEVPPLAFQNLSELHTVRLANNRLTTVNLQGPYLMHVAVGSNSLSEDGLVLNSPALIVLDLSECGLRRLPENVLRTTPNLQRLKLEQNLLSSLDVGILSMIPHLRMINLTGNEVTFLHVDIFQHNNELTHLDLSKNPLQLSTDGGFIHSSSIQVLSLAACNLSRVSAETFRGMPNITSLKLSDNKLRSLSNLTFSVLPNLEYLSLDGNRIFTVLADFVSGLSKLVYLNLSRNPIQLSTDEPFLKSNSLNELILDECFLETVPATTLRLLPNLTSLSLSNNQLPTLDVQTVQVVSDLNHLAIDGNPLICDCPLLPLWQWCSIRQCEKSIVRCKRPRGRSWVVLSDLVCEDGSVSPSEDFDIDLEVEMVDIPIPSRRPPERLTI